MNRRANNNCNLKKASSAIAAAIVVSYLLVPYTFAQPNPELNVQTEGDQKLTLENSLHLRDPFREPDLKNSLEDEKDLAEMDSLTLDQFKLVGVITGPEKNKALLQSPSGRMYILSENMKIGARNGVIKKISPKNIMVEETVLNLLGQEEKIRTRLSLVETPKKESPTNSYLPNIPNYQNIFPGLPSNSGIPGMNLNIPQNLNRQAIPNVVPGGGITPQQAFPPSS